MICKVDRFFDWVTQLTVLFSYSSPGYRDASDTKCHTIYTLIVEIISWYICKAPYKRIFSTWRIWCSANWSLETLSLLSPKKYEVFSAAQELYNVKKLKMIKTEQPVGYPMIEHLLGFNIICAQGYCFHYFIK